MFRSFDLQSHFHFRNLEHFASDHPFQVAEVKECEQMGPQGCDLDHRLPAKDAQDAQDHVLTEYKTTKDTRKIVGLSQVVSSKDELDIGCYM